MSSKKVEELVTEIALPIVEKHNFELVDVEFLKEGANWYLRIYIDKPGGISIDDCQLISYALEPEIDKKDPIKQGYIFEVSSPGLNRQLKKEKDFERYKGQDVEVQVFKPVNKQKIFVGELLGLMDNKVEIKTPEGEVLSFERDKISSVKRFIKI